MPERTSQGVITLVARPPRSPGWGYKDIVFRYNQKLLLSGDPNKLSTPTEFQDELLAAYQHTRKNRPNDFNGPKIGIRSLSQRGDVLVIEAVSTDYFTLRGIPFTAPELHKQAIEELSTLRQTEIPTGISAHTILLINDAKAVMTINTAGHGFAPGRLSLTFEGQMDPKDRTPFHTVQRELKEELGREISLKSIRLLAIGAETEAAYTAWCFVVSVAGNPDSIRRSWEKAKTREASALLIAPVAELGHILLPETQAESLQKYVAGGTLDAEREINPHPTVLWRYGNL